jgi:hypothetical protein
MERWPARRADRFSEFTGRLRRAVDNHFEAMAFFTIAVVVVTLSGAANAVTIDEKTVVSSIGGRGRAGGPAAVVDGSLEPGPRKQGQGLGPRRLQPC